MYKTVEKTCKVALLLFRFLFLSIMHQKTHEDLYAITYSANDDPIKFLFTISSFLKLTIFFKNTEGVLIIL
ncbi:MAG: hypothetical protein HC817_10825 [Saprospiraceae bacterium]|nr:hypothetical protein [Saprospiraceae bacterium]